MRTQIKLQTLCYDSEQDERLQAFRYCHQKEIGRHQNSEWARACDTCDAISIWLYLSFATYGYDARILFHRLELTKFTPWVHPTHSTSCKLVCPVSSDTAVSRHRGVSSAAGVPRSRRVQAHLRRFGVVGLCDLRRPTAYQCCSTSRCSVWPVDIGWDVWRAYVRGTL